MTEEDLLERYGSRDEFAINLARESLWKRGLRPCEMALIVKNWWRMSDDEQLRYRATRARMGVKCSDCGTRGYYRPVCAICPRVAVDEDTGELVPLAKYIKAKKKKRNYEKFLKKLPQCKTGGLGASGGEEISGAISGKFDGRGKEEDGKSEKEGGGDAWFWGQENYRPPKPTVFIGKSGLRTG